MKTENIKKIILPSIVIWIVTTVLGFITCGWLFNWVYQIPPNIWIDPEIMMSAGNMIGMNLIGLISAVIFVSVYAFLQKAIPGSGAKKGMTYGLIVWLVGTLTGIAAMSFYMTIATTVVVYWIIQGLVMNLINGAIVAKLYKEDERENKQEEYQEG